MTLVGEIKGPVWDALDGREQRFLLAIDDCNTGRFDVTELRRRLHELEPDPAAPHPLDTEEIRVEVTHVPTGFRGSAEDDPGTPVGETVGRALDELLRCLETGGGG